MKVNRRHERILEAIARGDEISVEELAARFAVSAMTIRRDLARMERAGRLHRTHGGALPARAGVIEFAFQDKCAEHADEKRAIAREVAARVEPGMAVTLDTGTTTLEVARLIAAVPRLTVLTTSLAIASVLYSRENIQLVLLGGVVGTRTPNLSGELTEENLMRFRAHLAILGADAVTPEGSFTTEVPVARVSRAMVEKADRVILAVDASKFAATAFVKCIDLDRIAEIVTDDGCPREARRWLRAAGPKVTFAAASGGRE